MDDLPELVPKIEGSNDRQFGSGAPVSINTLKATVAADLKKLSEMYESKIKAKHEQNMKWKNEWIDMKLERDLYSDKCKSLGRQNLELNEIVEKQKKEIESLKARFDSSEIVRSNPSVISPPAQFVENPLVVLLDSDSDGSESEVSVEPSPSVNIRSNSMQTSRKTSKAKTKISLEARMENALAKPRPWKCSICADRFETTKNLLNHVKAHHKDYKHFCSQCPHFSKYQMDGHERSHEENERKYKNRGGHRCRLCRVWYSQAYFGRHLQLYHGE